MQVSHVVIHLMNFVWAIFISFLDGLHSSLFYSAYSYKYINFLDLLRKERICNEHSITYGRILPKNN